MIVLWQIVSQVDQQKNSENQSHFGKDMTNNAKYCFLQHNVYHYSNSTDY